jgi:aspartate aminotransferase
MKNMKNMKKSLSPTSKRLVGQPMFSILSRILEIEKHGEKVIHFELGDPDFDAPKNVIQAVCKAMVDGNTHYAPSMGLPIFRTAIKDHLEREFNFRCDYEQVVITPGANSGIYWTMRCLMEKGDEVLLPDPGFPSFAAAAKAVGAQIVPIKYEQSNEFKPDMDAIVASISNRTKLIILNSPSNPIGSILSESDLSKIYQLAVEHDFYILSDDTYRRMNFKDGYPPSVTQYDFCKERSIMLGGLSKEYSMSGFRLGYLIGPHQFIKKVGLYIETVASCVSPFIQMGGVEALQGSQSNRIKNLSEIKARRDFMVKGLNQMQNISCHLSEGGLYLFPNVANTGLTGDQFFQLMLNQARISCVSGSVFGDVGVGHVRLSLNVKIPMIKKSFNRINDVLNTLNKGKYAL